MPLPRTTFEQRRPHYEDLVELLMTGFLSHPVRLNGVALSLRNIQDRDLYLIENRAGVGAPYPQWERWAIAQLIWMMDGYVLFHEPNSPVAVYKAMQGLPEGALRPLVDVVMDLTKRVTRASQGVTSYAYEDSSRSLWNQIQTHPMPSDRLAGIPGVETLGMNVIQRMWTAYNGIEDWREGEQARWDQAKFVASATNPKGVNQITSRDKAAHMEEKDRRQAVFDRFFYEAIGVLDADGKDRSGEKQFIIKASTPDELAEEMRKWVSGELDFHDKVVENYKQGIIQRYQAEQADRATRARESALAAQEEGESPLALQPLVGFSRDELLQMLRSKGDTPARRVANVIEEGKGRDYLYGKYLERPPTSGKLEVRDGMVVPHAPRHIQREIAHRQVQFGSGSVDEEK